MPSRRTVPAWAPATTAPALVLAVLATLLVVLGGPPASAATTDADPLGVTIDSLTPSTLKGDASHGTVRVSGTVTNDDNEAWQALNVYAFVRNTPLTTETELAEASISDPTAPVGDRITEFGDFATLPDLAPGASASFELSIPRSDLHDSSGTPITAPGVYWFGVQVLGNTSDGERDTIADGRARTFLPLVAHPGHAGPVKTALVVPLRQRVLRQPDGSIAAVAGWERQLSPGGRLSSLLDFAAGRQVSWLVDPAVVDAVEQLAAGNLPRSIAATDGTGDNGDGGGDTSTASPTPTLAPTVSSTVSSTATHDASPVSAERIASGSTSTTASSDESDPTAATAAAQAWLLRLTATLKQSPAVYALPYGDLDLSAVARHDPSLYAVARERGAAIFSGLGITAQPLDVPATGYLQPDAMRLGESTTPLLLSDKAISGTVPPEASLDGRTIYTTSSLVASGGPPPGAQLGPVPIRQELLAQASLRLAGDEPIVAVLPPGWSPGADAAAAGTGFFGGLDEPWLDLTTVSGAVATLDAPGINDSRLHYPGAEARAELPNRVFTAVGELRSTADKLQSVLPHNDSVSNAVLDDALTSASYTARGAAGAAGTAADRTRSAIDAQLRSITIEAPASVTLSSDQGKFNATVVNGLDEPIAVKVHAVSDTGLAISVPGRLEIPAKGHTGVLLSADARTNGVHNVLLQLTTVDGKPLASDITFPVRTAQVSRIIWLFIGGGLGLLLTAIVVRLVRRIRNRAKLVPAAAGEEGP